MSAQPIPDSRSVLEAGGSLVEALLADQRSLSAVDEFSRRHDDGDLPPAALYEERIPVGRTPLPGQQLAFRVDLDSCTGCKACVTACHSLNGLADDETWRDVGLLIGDAGGLAQQQTVTTACHHCEDPACLNGCPVQAYEKDPITGIVRHLDDQCIGCQYCMLKCLYDVPKYSHDLGIVRKCDMCTGRLAQGEAPACVQGCPNGAITIQIVDQHGEGGATPLLPTAKGAIPDSAITRPTTRYVSRREHELRPAGLERLAPAEAHDPLAIMLVLMQLSVGALFFGVISSLLGVASPWASTLVLLLSAGSAGLGLGAATLHLGRPLLAYRAFLGWKTSWMSREILTFGAYVPALVGVAALSLLVTTGGLTLVPERMLSVAGALLPFASLGVLVIGIAGTFCSMMIYVDTRRRAWALSRTAPVFVGTLLGLGALGTALVAGVASWIEGTSLPGLASALLLLAVAVLAAKVASEAWLAARSDESSELVRTARLLRGPLKDRFQLRLALAGAGLLAALLAAVLSTPAATACVALAALLTTGLGELLERHLYFTAEATPGMPGH
ncbi:MAG: dimethyl sulfoxide reductase anchor subunit [Myxococcota bacterium]|nr:dimethyl sulfoxide reductase anchor subunit [Myxococcota bacterium]